MARIVTVAILLVLIGGCGSTLADACNGLTDANIDAARSFIRAAQDEGANRAQALGIVVDACDTSPNPPQCVTCFTLLVDEVYR